MYRRLRVLPLAVALLATSLPLAAGRGLAPAGSGRYAGRPLAEVLQELRSLGLEIVFTSTVVPPEMVVGSEPRARRPRAILDEILAPHGLEARQGPGGVLVIVERAPAPGRLAGVVRAGPRKTPLAGARVKVVETGQTAVTGGDGGFELPAVEESPVTLEVTATGYLGSRLEQLSPPAEQLMVDLARMPVLAEELVVTPSHLSLLRRDPGGPLDVGKEEIASLPHLGDDLFRALTLLPGTTSNDVSAQFQVRGSRRDETSILLDGQELYDAFHLKDFDDALSIVQSSTLEKVDLSTGGFSAEHGDRMSGVLSMTTITPSVGFQGLAGFDLTNARVGAGGLLADGRGSWLAQARLGATEVARHLLTEEEPKFWDAFLKTDYRFGTRASLRGSLLYTGDELSFSETTPESFKTTDTGYVNSYAWATQQLVLGAKTLVDTSVSLSRVERQREGEESDETVHFTVHDNRDLEVGELRQEWTTQPTQSHTFRLGFELRRFDAAYDYAAGGTFSDPVAALRHRPVEDSVVFVERLLEQHHGAYVTDRWRPMEPLTLELGLRSDRYTQTDEEVLSPRFNLAWAVGKRSVFRVAWGRFAQSQRPNELEVEDASTAFQPVERSEHRVIGFERFFEGGDRGRGLALRVEAYQRRVRNPRPRFENLYEPLNTFPEVEPDRVLIAPDRSLAQGIELFLRGGLGTRARWWVNYALASSDDEIDGETIPRSYDQTHTLNLDLALALSSRWHLNVAWRYHTGWPTTPLSVASVPVSGDEGEEEPRTEFVPVLGRLNSRRLGAYHRLDLRATRRWQLSSGTLTFYLDVQNLYDRANPAGFDIEIDDETGELRMLEESWTRILPSFGIAFEF